MVEIEREEEDVDLLTVVREEIDDETLFLVYKWEVLDTPPERRDKIMVDVTLQVMRERGMQIPTVQPSGEVDYGKYAYLKDYDSDRFLADIIELGRKNWEEK